MKVRIISALILALLLIPIVIFGGIFFDITIYLISIVALNEIICLKNKKKKIPIIMKVITFMVFILYIYFFNNLIDNIFTFISFLLIIFLIPTVLYHNQDKYSINDAFYLIGSVLFLSFSFASIIYLRHLGFNIIFYIILIACMTDTYAYFGGYLIGRHKLIKEVSPNKTWEGTIIGTIMCVIVCTIYYYNFINGDALIIKIGIMSLILSVLGQFGDLVFSSIKRYYGVKDYSNLIPGHGGILDRLDSIIFIVLGYMFMMTII